MSGDVLIDLRLRNFLYFLHDLNPIWFLSPEVPICSMVPLILKFSKKYNITVKIYLKGKRKLCLSLRTIPTYTLISSVYAGWGYKTRSEKFNSLSTFTFQQVGWRWRQTGIAFEKIVQVLALVFFPNLSHSYNTYNKVELNNIRNTESENVWTKCRYNV